MAKRTIILLPVANPYQGHSADAPQVKDKLRIPNAPNVDVAKALGVDRAAGPEVPNSGTVFKKTRNK